MVRPTSKRVTGFSLIELLVILIIVGVLSLVGVTMIGNRTATAVRSVMDEIEGTLAGAHQLASSGGGDVTLGAAGDWNPASSTPLVLAYSPNTALSTSDIATAGREDAHAFLFTKKAREYMHAGVATNAKFEWWTTAIVGIADVADVEPFKSTAAFQILDAEHNLFGGAKVSLPRISGVNKRFTNSFWVPVVSLSNGNPIKGGPVGIVMVLEGGATIYKFYNPGTMDGADGQWRKL